MVKIKFVCHGNICRSPMAEFVMKKLVENESLSDFFEISSAATSAEEIYNGIGNPVYPPAKRELSKHGIGCEGKRAVQLKEKDYDKYDLFICMDSNNIRNIKHIFKNDPESKIRKLMDYTDRKNDIADPWYTGDFETTYNDIYEGCTELLKKLKEGI